MFVRRQDAALAQQQDRRFLVVLFVLRKTGAEEMSLHSIYLAKAKALRHNPMVEAWIAKSREMERQNYTDCKHCGWPHNESLLCFQADFGTLWFCGELYGVDESEVVWWVDFMQAYAPQGAFHWKNERFFLRTNEGIEMISWYKYNNTPQKSVVKIPLAEWQTIVSQMGKK